MACSYDDGLLVLGRDDLLFACRGFGVQRRISFDPATDGRSRNAKATRQLPLRVAATVKQTLDLTALRDRQSRVTVEIHNKSITRH